MSAPYWIEDSPDVAPGYEAVRPVWLVCRSLEGHRRVIGHCTANLPMDGEHSTLKGWDGTWSVKVDAWLFGYSATPPSRHLLTIRKDAWSRDLATAILLAWAADHDRELFS